MPEAAHSFADHLAALGFLGLARCLEWQALTAQAVLIEGSQARREWRYLQTSLALTGVDNFLPEPAMNFADVMTVWCMGAVRGQLTAAHGLLAQCALPYLDPPRWSGRRHAGFDAGRRRSAVVIAFPDRRRPESRP